MTSGRRSSRPRWQAASCSLPCPNGVRRSWWLGNALFISTALAAIVAAILVPTVNIVSSLGFALLRTGPRTALGMLRVVATNPLVLGCAAGGVWNLVGVPVPDLASAVLDPLAAAALLLWLPSGS